MRSWAIPVFRKVLDDIRSFWCVFSSPVMLRICSVPTCAALSNPFGGKPPLSMLAVSRKCALLQRTKFDIKAQAVVDIKAVMRTPGISPQLGTIEYSSYDDETPMMEGGPQYQLRPGVWVIVFANSSDTSIPPGYLAQGSRQELLERVEALRGALTKMSPDQLKVNEITEDDRLVQISLYEKLSAYLRAAK